MSFLSGIANFGRKAIGFLSGDSIASSLVKTAVLGYAVNRLSKSAIKDNNSGTQNIDKGVRLQLNPNAESKIPVLYGDAYFGGNLSDAAMTNDNKTMWYCLTLAEVTGNKFSDSNATSYTFHDVYWNQQRIVFRADGITADYAVDSAGTIDRSISGLVKVYFYAGGSSAGLAPDGYATSTPNADTVFPNWTSLTHPMTDLVFALVRVDYNREKNVTGIGEMMFQVESDMKKPGDVFYDYMTSSVYGVGVSSSEINTTSVTALNTYSDSSVAYNDEGTGAQTLPNRYQINGLIDTDENVLKNAEQILSAAASWLSYDIHEGLWSVVINKAGTSVASFSDDNILGNISVGGTGLQDLYNSVKVEFAHRDLRDSGDFVKIEIASADRNANEPDNTLNVTYDIINEPVQAELLGFIELKQSRVDLVVQFETDFSYINLKAGEIIDLTNSGYNFSSKLFRILSVAERQDTDGAIRVEITALEYDSDVYSVQDITRFTRSDDNGIITIGSIGVPNVPQITKFERSNRPRIEIETIAPTGVVEGIEFWITFDDEEPDDTLRSYTLIGTKRPVGGGVYTSGTTVVFDYDNLGAENFYVKVRGINTTTTGPFSDPSAFVEFVPEVVPDAITPDTSVLDSTGGLATALGVVSLLNNLDGIYEGLTGEESLFDAIFGTFEDVTGFDIVGETSSGNFVVPTNIAIQDEGSEVASSVSVINFTGASVEVSADGTTITVNHTGDGGDPEPEPDPNDPTTPGSGGTSNSILRLATTLPTDRGTYEDPLSDGFGNFAPATGSYFAKWELSSGDIHGSLTLGSGNAYLYKSDGTLVETLATSACSVDGDVLELPFADRDLKTDYYILIDDTFVTYCNATTSGVNSPTQWNFNTPAQDRSAYTGLTPSNVTINVLSALDSCGQTLEIVLNNSYLQAGSGTLTIEDDSSTVVSLTPGDFTVGENSLTYSGSLGLSYGTSYTLTIPEGFVLGGDECNVTSPNAEFTQSVTTPSDLALTGFFVDSDEWEPDDSGTDEKVEMQTNIGLVFNSSVSLGTGNISIYKAGGTLHQQIDVATSFASNNTSELIWVSGNNVVLNPTVDLEQGEDYYVLADAGTVVASCSRSWSGISNNTTVAFTADPGPTVESIDQLGSTGPYGNTGVINEEGIALNFDRDVSPGSGNINIYDESNNLVAAIPSTDPSITYGA